MQFFSTWSISAEQNGGPWAFPYSIAAWTSTVMVSDISICRVTSGNQIFRPGCVIFHPYRIVTILHVPRYLFVIHVVCFLLREELNWPSTSTTEAAYSFETCARWRSRLRPLRYKSESPGFDSRWCYWKNCFIHTMLPAASWPWLWLSR